MHDGFCFCPSDEDLSLGTPVSTPDRKEPFDAGGFGQNRLGSCYNGIAGVIRLRIDFRTHRTVCSQYLRRERQIYE